MSKTKVLQGATVISKTTQTLIGEVIGTGHYDFLTLFFLYEKGDETGLIIQAHALDAEDGIAYQDQSWTAAAGTKTHTLNQYTPVDAVPHYLTFDVRGISFVKFTQGGSNNDGTPTGTLTASYTLK